VGGSERANSQQSYEEPTKDKTVVSESPAAAAMSDAGDYKLPVNGLMNRLALKAKLVGDEKQQGRR
jgi:hypothetical protein